jgi:hypothetical protein
MLPAWSTPLAAGGPTVGKPQQVPSNDDQVGQGQASAEFGAQDSGGTRSRMIEATWTAGSSEPEIPMMSWVAVSFQMASG